MRFVTVAENLGPAKVPGADHSHKFDKYGMLPGTAWKLDETGERTLVRIDKALAEAARYDWMIANIDGRNVAEFLAGGLRFAQPIHDDPKAKDTRLGSSRLRKLRKPKHEAPGVAPEVPTSDDPEPAPRKAKVRRPKRELTIEL